MGTVQYVNCVTNIVGVTIIKISVTSSYVIIMKSPKASWWLVGVFSCSVIYFFFLFQGKACLYVALH